MPPNAEGVRFVRSGCLVSHLRGRCHWLRCSPTCLLGQPPVGLPHAQHDAGRHQAAGRGQQAVQVPGLGLALARSFSHHISLPKTNGFLIGLLFAR